MTEYLDPAGAVKLLRSRVVGDFSDIVVDLAAGEGATLVDAVDGTRYLDMTSFFASAPLGGGHPGLDEPGFLADLLAASKVKPSNPDFATVAQARFVATFHRVLGAEDLPFLFLIDGGALAVENALKVAFDWKTKHNAARGIPVRGSRVLHLEHAFHGRSGYTMSLTNTDPRKVRDFPVFDWPRIAAPVEYDPVLAARADLLPAELAALDAARAAFRRHGAEIACFIYEPIQGEGGDRHLRAPFLRALEALCREYDALTVADEVQTGCGAAGAAWAHQELGLRPDLIAFGKKTQVCGVLGGRRVAEIEDNAFREPSRISSTWGGGLTDMVRASRILEIVESERLFDNVRAQGARLLAGLSELARDLPEIFTEPRGRGGMAALTIVDTATRDELITAARTHARLLVLPCGTRSVRLRPPLSVRPGDIDAAVAGLRAAAGVVRP